ncbi:MAG: hypothetical protein LQ339_007935 [Xanthoria mediterranea]|nr:MAG: hypothetical protein LQ339_007935 [Xanthoria mediterranea]
MIPAVHHTQPVDPLDLDAKLRDCAPRTSEPPDSAGLSRDQSETPDPPGAELLEIEAKEAYDTLKQLGGRPTGPIRSNPRWKTVVVNGELTYRHAEEEETIFHDQYFTPCPTYQYSGLTEAHFFTIHWGQEKGRCQEELRRWQLFRDHQQWIREHRPEKATEEETERQRYPHNPRLTASLKKLKDWRKYQGLFQILLDARTRRVERSRRAIDATQRKDAEGVSNKGEGSWPDLKMRLSRIEKDLKWLPAEEKRLEWAKQQLPAVLAECAASLKGRPTSRRLMEERSELEAKRVFNALAETGGRPTRPLQPVPASSNHEHADQHLHALRHWEGECTQFEEEWREWKKFLDYRQKKEADGRTEVQLQEQQSAETTTQVQLWKDYRAYRQLEVDNAKQWVEFWQRQEEEFQDEENHCALQGYTEGVLGSRYNAEDARSYGEEARKRVRPIEMRLEWVEQQLGALLAEAVVLTPEGSLSDRLDHQTKMPESASRSGQTSLKDNRLARRSNHGEKILRASAKSALDPIHSSKVSKAKGKEITRLRRQSKILAKHDDGQLEDPHTTTSPLLPANIVPRRSSRLNNNEKRSDALEATLAASPGNSARSPSFTPRRSDRISKQRKRMSPSTSNTTATSAMILQTDPSRCLSRSKSKGRRTGKKSDASSGVKPRGILKRPQRKSLRNKTKMYE